MQTITLSTDDIVVGTQPHTECERCHSTITVETPSLADLLQAEDPASRFRLPLTRAEARIFNCFYASIGQFIDARRLVLGSYGPNYLDTNYAHLLRVNIARMRSKLAANDSQFSIETQLGRGYRLVASRQLSFVAAGSAPAPAAA